MKAQRILVTPGARRDISQISTYIAADSTDASHRFVGAIAHDAALLLGMPRIGAMRDFLYRGLRGVRSLPVTGFRNYLIFYRPSRQGVTIVRVLHGARDLSRAWRSR